MPPKKKAIKDETPAIIMEQTVPAAAAEERKRDRLKLLKIRNFRCIGPEPVTIELDEIVVLVGANNAGKSTILRAYELVMEEGAKTAKLDLSEFPNGVVDPDNLPEIELHTVVHANPPGAQWVDNSTGEPVVREKWVWSQEKTAPKRIGFDVEAGDWAASGVPWGAAGVAKANRPHPHRISSFDLPEKQAEQITTLLMDILKQKVAEMPHEEEDEHGQAVKTSFGQLFESLGKLQREVVQQAETEIRAVEGHLTDFIGNIFRGYRVEFDARPEDDLTSAVSFFKTSAELRMGPEEGLATSIAQQGSGARRALMWAALKYVCENAPKKTETSRPHLLLLDEPELCLHPSAIRDACDLLYRLPDRGNWQVMVTTHSPAFIDLSRDNTTIVRVSRTDTGKIESTTVFRPGTVKLDPEEKEELKLLNLYDPHVAEFFFGGNVILVEGDTEYTAFKYVLSKDPGNDALRGTHIIRARGKVTIALMARILNAFKAPYAVLHDSDTPTCMRDGKEIANPAWTNNSRIREVIKAAGGRTRQIAMVPNFESVFFRKEAKSDKPYNAIQKLRVDQDAFEGVEALFKALVEFGHATPEGCVTWTELEQLAQAYEAICR
jgi:putative ATP-dependent endonuclease of OLD family